jgi:hypothetical protein
MIKVNEKKYPINNAISLPYYIRHFIEKGLVNVHIVEPSKLSSRHPKKIQLVFDNAILKKLIIDNYNWTPYCEAADLLFGNQLLILKYEELLKKAKQKKDEKKRVIDLAELDKKYCKAMKSSLLTMLSAAADTLITYNKKFDIQQFRTTCKNTNTVDAYTELSVKLIKAIHDSNAVLQNRYLDKEENKGEEKAVTELPSDNLTILIPGRITGPKINHTPSKKRTPSGLHIHTRTTQPEEDKEENTSTLRQLSSYTTSEGMEGEEHGERGERGEGEEHGERGEGEPDTREGVDDTEPGSVSSPLSPRTPYLPNQELIQFMRTCNQNPVPKNPAINITGLTCRISKRICHIPLRSGNKVFDLLSINILPGYRDYDCFTDITDNEVIEKSSLQPAYDIRERTLAAINEEKYFRVFLQKYQEDYKRSWFKWSNFNTLVKQNKMNNFNDLFKYVTENPGSRSAKVFANMPEELNNRFKTFMKKYLQDYQSSYFHRSIFLKEVKAQHIYDMDTTQAYAEAPEHHGCRTARVLRNF